jgi:membrane-associated phospholipid phosphatase
MNELPMTTNACSHCAFVSNRGISQVLALAIFLGACIPLRAKDGIETAGDILQFVLPAAAAGLTLEQRDWPGTLEFAESAALTLGVTYALKYTVQERRPNGGNESFPSGHTSISFSAAEFMRKRYGLEYGIPAYALASFVAYSRVESGQHHPGDVIAGASIGIVSSYIFTKPYKGWQVELNADGKWYGFKLSRRF